MTFNQLQYFCVTAQELHFGRAASRLHIAQPSLSSALMNLEQELGLALFERRGHKVILTEAGRELQRQAADLLERADCIQNQMRRLREGVDEEVRLSYTATALAAGLAEALDEFSRGCASPVRLITDQLPTIDSVQGLKDGRFDFSFCMKVEKEPEIEQILVVRAPYVLIAPPNCPLSAQSPLTELARYSFITYRSSTARAFVEALLAGAGLSYEMRHFTYSDTDAIRMVAGGLGVAVVNELFCREDTSVRVLRPDWLSACTQDLYLTRRVGSRPGLAARRLMDFLRTYPFADGVST